MPKRPWPILYSKLPYKCVFTSWAYSIVPNQALNFEGPGTFSNDYRNMDPGFMRDRGRIYIVQNVIRIFIREVQNLNNLKYRILKNESQTKFKLISIFT